MYQIAFYICPYPYSIAFVKIESRVNDVLRFFFYFTNHLLSGQCFSFFSFVPSKSFKQISNNFLTKVSNQWITCFYKKISLQVFRGCFWIGPDRFWFSFMNQMYMFLGATTNFLFITSIAQDISFICWENNTNPTNSTENKKNQHQHQQATASVWTKNSNGSII